VSNIYRERVVARGFGSGAWGWGSKDRSTARQQTAMLKAFDGPHVCSAKTLNGRSKQKAREQRYDDQ
jgi:hypothetical protein